MKHRQHKEDADMDDADDAREISRRRRRKEQQLQKLMPTAENHFGAPMKFRSIQMRDFTGFSHQEP